MDVQDESYSLQTPSKGQEEHPRLPRLQVTARLLQTGGSGNLPAWCRQCWCHASHSLPWLCWLGKVKEQTSGQLKYLVVSSGYSRDKGSRLNRLICVWQHLWDQGQAPGRWKESDRESGPQKGSNKFRAVSERDVRGAACWSHSLVLSVLAQEKKKGNGVILVLFISSPVTWAGGDKKGSLQNFSPKAHWQTVTSFLSFIFMGRTRICNSFPPSCGTVQGLLCSSWTSQLYWHDPPPSTLVHPFPEGLWLQSQLQVHL